jgi:hypothetical protein
MRKPSPILLKGACVLFGGLLLYQVVRLVVGGNPLSKVTLPGVPSLPKPAESAAGRKGTNAVAVAEGGKTNRQAGSTAAVKTNAGPVAAVTGGEEGVAKSASTNGAKGTATNPVVAEDASSRGSNVVAVTNLSSEAQKTNSAELTKMLSDSEEESMVTGPTNIVSKTTHLTATNVAAAEGEPAKTRATNRVRAAGTNLVVAEDAALKGSNAVAVTNASSGKKKTNSANAKEVAMAGMGPGFMGMPGMGGPAPELPPAIKARVNRIVDSEILGPVMRPMPMALMGIAGNVAFLRTATGQTGLAKEGEDVGGLKLLKIGINRVLVEDNGEKKELTIFSGLGGESLMPKTEPSHEHTNH